MRQFPRPIVVVSRCLEFDKVRYDGQVLHSRIVRDLEPFVDYIKVCPEVEIGLGVPREPIRIVRKDGSYRLIQPATGEDLTDRMNSFSEVFIEELHGVDGFIFKSKSPTIGLRNIKVYAGVENAPVVERSTGFFAGKLLEMYPGYPLEEEDRLRNTRIRQHFLTHLYTFAGLRELRKSANLVDVQDFLSRNEFLFLAYNKDIQKKMFELVQDGAKPIDNVLDELESLLKQLMVKPPDHQANIEAARAMFQLVAIDLSKKENKFFEAVLGRYEQNKICFSTVLELLKLHFLVSGKDPAYHSLLLPYPEELILEVDEDRDKDFWK
ncbi:DUF523 and DUF1722 domain-containing protein [uncultured Methanomethylovorans sp.]|uniref:YbgA family protein n=1 Tax=uncultured Methanomethylovorans sp. TaxID=183759 RepID=UPI002AA7C240|nr:DUF523 and DUF1722 domain-containing protein [uncultured Methanomethylovorans sp.]